MRNRRKNRPPIRRRSKRGAGSFTFVGEPLVFVCPFCPGGATVVQAGEIRHLDSTATTGAVLHPEPTCDEYMKNDPADYMRLSREHYDQHGKQCDHCGKRMIPSRPHAETMAEARAMWGDLGERHLTLCDPCFALEMKARAKGNA